MVVYQKLFEDDIARWKVCQPRYVLSKQLKKIHLQDFSHATTWEDGQWSKAGGSCT